MNFSDYKGVWGIFRYNWAAYLAALIVVAAAGGTLVYYPLPFFIWMGMGTALVLTLYWSLASLAASHWIYDRSKLYRWLWIPEILGSVPSQWVNIHAGLDESSLVLKRLFPGTEGTVLDIYDSGEMTEHSIAVARWAGDSHRESIAADFRKLPLSDGSADMIFLLFSAHELRQPESREKFFSELRRLLRVNGRILLVEHLRDWRNFAAFGPGFVHFLPRKEWLRLAIQAGLVSEKQLRMTPFIQIWLWRKLP